MSSVEQNGNKLRKEGKEIWKENKTKKISLKEKNAFEKNKN
jgi:hypothetical protein